MTFKDAVDLVAVPIQAVAQAVGRGYSTVLAYKNGDREAPGDAWLRLAAYMRSHARELEDAADEIDRTHGGPPPSRRRRRPRKPQSPT